ncbi:MAG TPA: hypothetical protein VGG27_13475 [Magnetospirillaceae bacterium]
MMLKRIFAGLVLAFISSPAWANSCPPYTYTLTNGTTADASQVMGNFNTIMNCASYFVGGTSTGMATVQVLSTVSPGVFSLTAGNRVTFLAGFATTGATTLNVAGTGAISLLKKTSSGLVPLVANDMVPGQVYTAQYDGSQYELLDPTVIASATVVPHGEIGGLVPSIDATSPQLVVDISAGTATDSTGTLLIAAASPLSVNLATSGAGGIDTGSIAASTWYQLYLINGPSGTSAVAHAAGTVFSTTGTTTVGSTSLTVASGTGSANGDQIVVQGAGPGGTNLETTIASGGGTTSIVLAAPAQTAVTTAPTWGIPVAAPLLPSGYTYYRYIGSTLTDASSHILPFRAVEVFGGSIRVLWKTVVTDLNGTPTIGATAVLQTVSVPPGIKGIWRGRITSATASTTVLISSPDDTDVASGTSATSPGLDIEDASAFTLTTLLADRLTSAVGQLRIRASGASAIRIFTEGYDELRRQ